MKPAYILVLSIFFIIHGCKSKTQPIKTEHQKQETPEALQDKSYDVSLISKRGGENLVGQLYDELLAKDNGLQNIEILIKDYQERMHDSLKIFFDFNAKNESYYNSANYSLPGIKDSVLAEKIKAMILSGKNNYKNSVSGINNLIQELDKKSISINDLHIALKIVKTLPVMEKYQKANMPSAKPIETIFESAREIITKEDSAMKH